ncbi:MAG: hypothetical protein M3Y57_05630 [Acidobacteriota bacterium]|nr:hypothetical protein [Acidobacteriota bacterium]
MSVESKMPAHWTDDQLIEHLYGIRAEDGHFSFCRHCRERALAMQSRRQSIEDKFGAEDEVSFDFLAAQRRRIHARLDQTAKWWQVFHVRRWAPAAAALFVMGAGLVVMKETQPLGMGGHARQVVKANVSDAQLAAEVSQLADDSEPSPTAPLQALFEE